MVSKLFTVSTARFSHGIDLVCVEVHIRQSTLHTGPCVDPWRVQHVVKLCLNLELSSSLLGCARDLRCIRMLHW